MEVVVIIENVNTKEKLKETLADHHKPFYPYFNDFRSAWFVAIQLIKLSTFKLAFKNSFSLLEEGQANKQKNEYSDIWER